jgi:hypothetical protein
MYLKCGLRLRNDRLIQAFGLVSHDSAIKEGTRKGMDAAKKMTLFRQRVFFKFSFGFRLRSMIMLSRDPMRFAWLVRSQPKESNIHEFLILRN